MPDVRPKMNGRRFFPIVLTLLVEPPRLGGSCDLGLQPPWWMYLSIQGIYAGTPLALRATSSRPRGYFDSLLLISLISSGQAPVLIDL